MERITDNKPTAEMNGKEEKPFFSSKVKVLLLTTVAILGAELSPLSNISTVLLQIVVLFCGAAALLYLISTSITIWKKSTTEKRDTGLTVWLTCQIPLMGYILWECSKILRDWAMA